MKKSLLAIVTVLLGMVLNAQVSVWDGTAEPWTNGSGTPEDPYLIENAQQLAYLAQRVNAPNIHSSYHYCIFADTYFLLTSDLDLGGNNGLLWTPIGKYDGINLVQSAFAGHFDGDHHIIHNMHVESPGDKSNLDFGLFGMVSDGSIKNIIMDSDCNVDIKYGVLSGETGMAIGGIIGMGYNVYLENCVNRANVSADVEYTYLSLSCGGLFGNLYIGSSVKNCHNSGDVYCRGSVDFGSISPAGIVSYATGCHIIGCTNSGNITGVKNEWGEQEKGEVAGGIVGCASGECSIEQCCNTGTLLMDEVYTYNDAPASCGGIVGCSLTLSYSTDIIIKNCYNVANLSAVTTDNNKKTYAGGIFGTSYGYWNRPVQHNITIENCYTVGTITADTVGGVLAHEGWITTSKEPIVSSSYYINSIESDNDYGVALFEDFMKSEAFVNILNAEGEVFMIDINNENNGYPVFVQRNPLNVGENITENEISVFPNPAKDHIKVKLSGKSECQSVEIYSLDGRMVKQQTADFETINIECLDAGIYIIKARMIDGNETAIKLVKE